MNYGIELKKMNFASFERDLGTFLDSKPSAHEIQEWAQGEGGERQEVISELIKSGKPGASMLRRMQKAFNTIAELALRPQRSSEILWEQGHKLGSKEHKHRDKNPAMSSYLEFSKYITDSANKRKRARRKPLPEEEPVGPEPKKPRHDKWEEARRLRELHEFDVSPEDVAHQKRVEAGGRAAREEKEDIADAESAAERQKMLDEGAANLAQKQTRQREAATQSARELSRIEGERTERSAQRKEAATERGKAADSAQKERQRQFLEEAAKRREQHQAERRARRAAKDAEIDARPKMAGSRKTPETGGPVSRPKRPIPSGQRPAEPDPTAGFEGAAGFAPGLKDTAKPTGARMDPLSAPEQKRDDDEMPQDVSSALGGQGGAASSIMSMLGGGGGGKPPPGPSRSSGGLGGSKKLPARQFQQPAAAAPPQPLPPVPEGDEMKVASGAPPGGDDPPPPGPPPGSGVGQPQKPKQPRLPMPDKYDPSKRAKARSTGEPQRLGPLDPRTPSLQPPQRTEVVLSQRSGAHSIVPPTAKPAAAPPMSQAVVTRSGAGQQITPQTGVSGLSRQPSATRQALSFQGRQGFSPGGGGGGGPPGGDPPGGGDGGGDGGDEGGPPVAAAPAPAAKPAARPGAGIARPPALRAGSSGPPPGPPSGGGGGGPVQRAGRLRIGPGMSQGLKRNRSMYKNVVGHGRFPRKKMKNTKLGLQCLS